MILSGSKAGERAITGDQFRDGVRDCAEGWEVVGGKDGVRGWGSILLRNTRDYPRSAGRVIEGENHRRGSGGEVHGG